MDNNAFALNKVSLRRPRTNIPTDSKTNNIIVINFDKIILWKY